jgi:hypothetical protein
MASSFKNTSIDTTSAITLAQGSYDQKPIITKTTESFTSGTSTWTCPAGVTQIELLVVAGGGGGGGTQETPAGGGGGAGGLIYRPSLSVTPGTSYTVTVGAGGTGGIGRAVGGSGGNSVFDTITAIGGGGGGFFSGLSTTGGSGGGAAWRGTLSTGSVGTANQGNTGGSVVQLASLQGAAGGGGAGSPGSNSIDRHGGGGGNGLPFDISGVMTYYAGGGGGGAGAGDTTFHSPGAGGLGGGGAGGTASDTGSNGSNGTANTGGGGGGAGGSRPTYTQRTGGAGGSGVVHIRYVTNLSTANANGILRYSTTSNAVEIYQNNDWVVQNPTVNYAGHNLARYSEQFANAVWLKSAGASVVSNSTTAPNGTITADTIVGDGAQIGYIDGLVSYTAGLQYTFSCYFKQNASTTVTMLLYGAQFNSGGSNITVTFNLANGTASGNAPFTITPVGDGWYRCSMSQRATATVTDAYQQFIRLTSNSGSVYAWGYQVQQSDIAGPYTLTEAIAAPTPVLANGYQIHQFTATGTTYWVPAQSGLVELLVVAGGGGGGFGFYGGGGGAGGLIYNKQYKVDAGKTYTVTVGAGGNGSSSATSRASNGGNSQFGSLIAIGGGGGGSRNNDSAGQPSNGNSGGSGGGGSFPPNIGGAGVFGQGNNGGGSVTASGTYSGYGMGGGGAGGPGQSAGFNARYGAQGGGGLGYDISGTLTYYAGGGGGGGNTTSLDHEVAGGIGGGGNGGRLSSGTAGTANTGGGGGGSGASSAGSAGGSGIVIVRYVNNVGITGTLDGSSPQRAATSAAAIKTLTGTTTNGFYWINLPVAGPTLVFCDMNTDGGGWMHCGTFTDNNERHNNAQTHPWAAPLFNSQYTGIWQDNSVLGTQSFTADFKNNVWNYFPMTQQLMKDSGASLRNLWYTGANQITAQSLSTFWSQRQWLGSDSDASASAVTGGRVHYQTITNFSVNDPVFGSSSLDKILFKWGEADGVQDGNKDRAMISYVTGGGTDVDAPKGIGCFTSFGSGYSNARFRDIVPTAQNTEDSPVNSITGTHSLTLWVR